MLKRGADVAGWKLVKRAAPGKDVWFAHHKDGRRGVLKACSAATNPQGKPSYTAKRFHAEVAGMLLLKGQPGVLPVLDVDPDLARPGWLVTAEAKLLAAHYGQPPAFRDVVDGIAQIAETLHQVRERHDVAHRDLKPDNLFWLNDHPVVGDFGIARWPAAAAMTNAGGKVGPWGYIAPEALEVDGDVDWYAADVYSLAKCLWALTAGRKFPLQGTLFIREEAASLYPFGGTSALELGRLLELATTHRPHVRPRMSLLANELRCWLAQHGPGSVTRPDARSGQVRFTAFPDMYVRQVDAGGPVRVGEVSIQQLLTKLRNCSSHDSEIVDLEASAIDVDLHSVGIPDPDWQPYWVVTKALHWPALPSLRLVAQGVGESEDDILYMAQWQTITSGAWLPATTLRFRHSITRLPSDENLRAALVEELTADSVI